MSDHESIVHNVHLSLVQKIVAEEKKKSADTNAGNKGKPVSQNTADKAVNTPFNTDSKDANKEPAHAQTVNTADEAVNTDSKIVPAQTSAISPNSNPKFQKTAIQLV